jgi:uncharacterized protein YaaN involved in tellurite resistance
MTLELTPPEGLQPPVPLEAPKPVAPVTVAQADGLVKLEAATIESLDAKVAEFVETVIRNEVHTEPFKSRINAIHHLGAADIRAAASVSNRMLDKPAKAMESGLFDDGATVTKALVDLRKVVEDLDPSRYGDLLSPRKIFGLIPAGNKIRDYFLKYQSSQSHLNAIINSLYHSQDELQKDNAAIEEEKLNLWGIMGKLQQYVYVGRKIDAALEARIAHLETSDPEKARVVKEELLFYVRQKVQDLLTQLAVSIQGYLALDMLRKNNLELIKGVDRATTTTVSALRTAVIVAQALANQKLVLDQIGALNTTTSNLIESTSAMLKTQSARIQQQAASSTVSLEKLQTAFGNIYTAMDMISDFKIKSLDAMQQTVTTLATEVEKSQRYLDRVRDAEAIEATGGLLLEDGDDIRI